MTVQSDGPPAAARRTDTNVQTSKPRARAIVATLIGNSLEWFDFAAYAFFATLIGHHFFPPGNDAASLLSTFAVFGVGFVARPLGAVIFGRLGDTKGRKLALLVVIPLMGLGTLMVGVAPSYESLGIVAPIILVLGRLLQGFSAGGELGNAVTYLTEWAPDGLRGLVTSLQQCSVVLGTLLGSGCAALLTGILSQDALESWGWRVPFLIGGLIIAPLGLFLRRNVEESPEFVEMEAQSAPQEEEDSQKAPSTSWKAGAMTIAVTGAWVVAYYVLLIYLPTFLPNHAGASASTALWASTVGLTAMMFSIPIAGYLSDRIGRKPLFFVAAIICVIAPYPMFSLLTGGAAAWQIYASSTAAGIVVGIFAGIGPVLMSEMFPTKSRTTGVAVSFGLATAILGGFAPFVSEWLIKSTGSAISPTFLVIAAAIVSAIAIIRLKESAFGSLKK